MRTREEIEKGNAFPEAKMVEVLLDIRQLLQEGKIIPKLGKMGRPKGSKNKKKKG